MKDGRDSKIVYRDGTIVGYLSGDQVCIAGLCLDRQTFTQATYVYSHKFVFYEFDGYMGMGLQNTSDYNLPTIFDTLVKRGEIDDPVFSVWMKPTSEDYYEGVMVLGGIEESLYTGDFRYVSLLDENSWHVQMDGITVDTDSSLACINGCKALIDTGCTFIMAPPDQIIPLNKAINASINYGTGEATIDCATIPDLPEISISLGGQQFVLNSDDYIFQMVFPDGTMICQTGFFSNDVVDNVWHLGTAFLANYYTVFDAGKKQVGFALARKD